MAKSILVAGGAGGVGEAIVRALLRAGHRAIVPSRNLERLERLRADAAREAGPGELVTFAGEIGTLHGAQTIRDRIERAYGRLDVLIPSLGGWWEGDLLEATPGVWDSVMDELLRTHFVFAHVFVPVLRAQPEGGRYIGIGGGAAYHPVHRSSLVSIAAAAQLMLTRALRAEVADSHVDVLELVVDGPVRTRDSAIIAAPDWIPADDVAAIVTELAERGRSEDPSISVKGPIVRMRPRARAENASV
jgi:NAD(P)-dependent dehydrogenase (short-subunit alcohol dehydrogenase family)